MITIGERLALQTAAVRRGNGFATATIALATNGYQYRYGAHVTCSANVQLGRDRRDPGVT